jgi:GT2 family glycosyltransferase
MKDNALPPMNIADIMAAGEVIPDFFHGVEGANRVHLAVQAFNNSPQKAELLTLGSELLYWSWQRDPLNSGILDPLLQGASQAGFLEDAPSAFLSGLKKALDGPPPAEGIAAALAEDPAGTFKMLLPAVHDETTALHILSQCWETLLKLGNAALPQAMLNNAKIPELLKARLQAEFAFHFLAPDEALAVIAKVDQGLFAWWKQYYQAELQLRMGDGDKAAAGFSALWRRIPWHVNLAHKLRTLLSPLPLDEMLLERESVAVCVYSWNKAEPLRDTLESLATSKLGKARIVVMDNGSDDGTAAVIEASRALYPADRFESLRVPTNLGAPGARNWMLALESVKACDHVAFLDDDVLLPGDWLVALLGRAVDMGKYGAVGCRITSSQGPAGLQSADYHLARLKQLGIEDFEERDRILLPELTLGRLDDGIFSYDRACISVTGCCHLISAESIRDVGAFDIRFNPTQFDDLDRDLRCNKAGFPVYYHGSLAVQHVGHSSLAKAKTPAAVGHIFGNKMKLEGKYEDAEIVDLAERDFEAGRKELGRSLSFLEKAL